MIRTTLSLFIALFLAAPIAAQSLETEREKIVELAQPLLESDRIVGMSIGIIKDGKQLTIHLGETKKGSGRTPDDQTIYEIGSISKVFTGTLLADAIARGEVELDDPLQSFLPEGVNVPRWEENEKEKEVLLRHLTTHTSGLSRMPNNFSPADRSNPYADYTFEQMYAYLDSTGLRTKPGEKAAYSNIGAALLGHAFERKTGMAYEQLLIERICAPLEMNDTRITLDSQMNERFAQGHNQAGEPTSRWDIITMAGAGGIRSTVPDMLRFLQANLDCDESPLGRAMERAQQPLTEFSDDGLRIGMNWIVARDGVTRWHNGQTGGYTASAWLHRPTGTAAVVLTNCGNGIATPFGERTIRILQGADVPGFEQREEAELTDEQRDALLGTYQLFPQFAITITRNEAGHIFAQATNQPKFRIFATSPTEFEYRDVKARIVFELDESGKAKRMVLHQNGLEMPGERVAEVKK